MELVTLRDGAFEPVEFILESDSVALEHYAERDGLSLNAFFLDEDGDGDLDIVYPRNHQNSILFEQIAPMVFAPARQIAFRVFRSPITRGPNVDLDGDGDLDLVSTHYGSVQINLARSPGAIRNFSTNSFVGTAGAVQICGFVIKGESPQTVILRGLGPGVFISPIDTKKLQNPRLRLHAGRRLIASNDDWRDHPVPVTDLIQSGISIGPGGPGRPHDREAALRIRLKPGAYTVNVKGELGDSGVGICAIDVDRRIPTDSMRVNMSGRTWIGRDQNIAIGGFVIEGDSPVKVLIRGLGPSLAERGLAAHLVDPQLKLHKRNEGIGSNVLSVNDDWRSVANANEIAALPNAPKHGREAAILTTLAPGRYTVHMSDSGGGTGIGIIAVDRL